MKTSCSMLLALGLSLSLFGCATHVVGGADDTASDHAAANGDPNDSSSTGPDGNGGSGTGGMTGTGGNPNDVEECGPAPGDEPPPAPTSAIAILASQIDWNAGAGGSGTTSSSSGGGPDPNTLYLLVGSPAPACGNPYAVTDCTDAFTVSIGLPPALQQPGTIALGSSQIISTFSESSSDCGFGGGSFTDGTLEIVSIDGSQVTFTLSGTMLFSGEGVIDNAADGTYTAARCP